jgi:hypothetical protein
LRLVLISSSILSSSCLNADIRSILIYK